jgi:hypothetical protein
MDEWKQLCSHVDTEGRITSRLKESGLLCTFKDALLKKVVLGCGEDCVANQLK